MAKLRTLTDGLLNELKDLYSAESQLLKALPRMEKRATNPNLKEAIKTHIGETEGQLDRLNEIGSIMQEKLSGKTCKAMQGLIEEGKEVLEEESDNDALIDALLIGAAQRVEHYEIAAYGTACAMARELGEEEIANLLAETLDEEKAADRKLSTISEDEVLVDAGNNSDSDEDEKRKIPPQRQGKKAGNSGKALALIGGFIILAQTGPNAWAESNRAMLKNEKEATQYKADDTGRNVRDRNENKVTADDQSQDSRNVEVLANVRKAIVANDNLSAYGKNVKIMVENKTVNLRGPVRTAAERSWIEQTVTRVTPGYRVVNELEIAPNE